MATTDPLRRDARHCPRCGARGILPLDQPRGDRGQIENPVMLCPVCREEFRAAGMTWLGAFRPSVVGSDGLTDEQIEEMAEAMANVLLEERDEQTHSTGVGTGLLDPAGGPENDVLGDDDLA